MKNIFDIKNKIIIITGGAGFLGSEFAMAISNVRATPVVLDKNDLALKSLKKKEDKLYLVLKFLFSMLSFEFLQENILLFVVFVFFIFVWGIIRTIYKSGVTLPSSCPDRLKRRERSMVEMWGGLWILRIL